MNDVPPGWELRPSGLHRELTFADFAEAFAFMTEVAAIAEELGHHPDWSNSWNRVTIDLRTHDADQVTDLDHALATRIGELLPVR